MKKLIVILLSILIYFACSEKKEGQSINETKLKRIASVNYPLHFFVTKIGGSKVDAIYPIPTGVDPTYWEPSAEDIILYQEADLILLNGAGYAKWVDKVSLPQSKMINTSLPFKDKYIGLEEGQTHSHGPEGEHEHKGFAFTTWLDFNNAIIQAEEVYKALSNLLPDSKETFSSNLQSLKNEIADLHKKMSAATTKFEGTTLVASHPVYQYLSNGYDLKIISFHWETDRLPDDMMWEGFEKTLASSKATIMLWEDTPLSEVNDKLINLGVKAIVFNPCANTPANGDFLSIMKTNIVNLGDL